jgi:hypothetical protein
VSLLSGAVSLVAVALLPFVAGCSDDDPVAVDTTAPFPPGGVFSITGDQGVEIFWSPNWEADLDGYAVYVSDNEVGPYDHISDVDATITSFVDANLNNGETWYYAVTAFDLAGNESDLSVELVFDTPRPQGTVSLSDFMGQNAATSGYDLSSVSNTAQPWNSVSTDIYFGQQNNVNLFFATNMVDIQDFGVTESFDDLDYAPVSGWAPSKSAEAIPDHGYFVRIANGQGGFNYAKLRVSSITGNDADTRSVTLEWAYQTSLGADGNRELSPGWKGGAGQ